jgi:hypothetical protein
MTKRQLIALVAFVVLVFAGRAVVPTASRAAADPEACRKQLNQCDKRCVHAGGSEQREDKQLQCLEDCAKRYHQCMSG